MTAEASLERKVRLYAEKHGVYTRKFSSPAHRGVPDRMFIKEGRILFLEFKARGKKPTAIQQREIDLLNKEDMPTFWVDTYEAAWSLINDFLLSMS